jgi:hypothetical protein
VTEFKEFMEAEAPNDIAALGPETVTLTVAGGSPAAVEALVDEIGSDFEPAGDGRRTRRWRLTFDSSDYATVTEMRDKVTVRSVDAAVIARESVSLGHTVVIAEEETRYARAATDFRETD